MILHLDLFRRAGARALPLCGALLLLGASAARAQQGGISGTVVDSESGQTLIGVNVLIQGTTVGTATDLDGRYALAGLAPGRYDLVFSFIGYDRKTASGVTVRPGEHTRLDASLSPEAVGLGEVTVEAEAMRNSETALLRDRQRAAAVSDAISAEAIGRSGGSTASDALRKVTGASVVGGRYVYIRGLGERYVNTRLDGVTLPTADPDRNAVPLDLFPAGLVDQIVTTKSFTPDRPGSFTGGSVDIGTKAYPESFSLSLSSSVGYNTGVGFGGDVLSYRGASLGSRGMQKDKFALPAELRTPGAVPALSEARRDRQKAELLDRYSKALFPVMVPSPQPVAPNQSYSLSAGNQLSLFGRPLGAIAAANYNRTANGTDNGGVGRYSLDDPAQHVQALGAVYELGSTTGGEELLWGGMANVSYKLTPLHEIGLNYLRNHSAESSALYYTGSTFRQLLAEGEGRTFETRALKYVERDISSLQLHGEHALLPTLRAEWNTALASTRQDEPDTRFFSNEYGLDPSGERTVYSINAPALYDPPSRYFRDLEEESRAGSLDLIYTFRPWSGRNARLKLGGSFDRKERAFHERLFQVDRDANSQLSPKGLYAYRGDPDRYFGEGGLYDTVNFGGPQYVFGTYLVDLGSPGNYTGEQQVAAGYGMVDLPLAQRLRLITGVRFEHTDMSISGSASEDGSGNDTTGTIREGDLLPAASLVYQLGENTNLRAAYGRTLARPTFREMAPYSTFEFIGGEIVSGNPALERTLVDNLDLRWEWFSRPGEIFAVSGFYKRFHRPIERVYVTVAGASVPEITFANVENGRVAGLELEARKRLDQLGPVMSHFLVGGNLTLAYSRVRIDDAELAEIRQLDPGAEDERPMQGQSPYVVNLDASYSNARSGTEIGVFYNLFGDRLLETVRGASPDVYEQARGTIDLLASQELFHGVTLKASVKNLLNSDVVIGQSFKDRLFQNEWYEPGRTISIGVTYRY